MINRKVKEQYAEAIISGSMSRSAAFITIVNPKHRRPSQGAYKLEQTKVMEDIFNEATERLASIRNIEIKKLSIRETALDKLNVLLESESVSFDQQLQLLRIAKGFIKEEIDRDTSETNKQHDTQPVLDKSIGII